MKKRLWKTAALIMGILLTAAQPVSAFSKIITTPGRGLDIQAGSNLDVNESFLTAEAETQPDVTTNVTELTAEADGRLNQSYIDITVKGTGGVSVNSSSTGGWLKIGSSKPAFTEAFLAGSGRIYVAADENKGDNDRTGTITITHSDGVIEKKVTVTQKAAVSYLILSTDRITEETEKSTPVPHFDVDTNGTGGFHAEVSDSDSSWLQIGRYVVNRYGVSDTLIAAELSFDGSGEVYVVVSKNEGGSERTGTITITHENGTLQKTVEVVQKGTGTKKPAEAVQNGIELKLTVSKTSLTAEADGKMPVSSIEVDTGGTGGFHAEVSDSGSWLKIGKNTGGGSGSVSFDDSGILYLSAAKNETADPRTASITITHKKDTKGSITKTIEVKQAPAVEAVEEVVKVTTDELIANAEGKISPNAVKVSTNHTGGCTVSTAQSWIKIGRSQTPASNNSFTLSDGSTFYAAADKNIGNARTGTITVTHQNGVTKTEITVKQDGMPARLSLDGSESDIEKKANKDGSFYNHAVSVKTEGTGGFTVKVTDSSWLKISKEKYAGFASGYSQLSFDKDAEFYLTASKNNTGKERTAEITVTHGKLGSLKRIVTVKQVGYVPPFILYTERVDFYKPAAGTSREISISTDDDTHWQAQTSEGWIYILEHSYDSRENQFFEKTGSGGFYIGVDKNDSLDERAGIVTVSGPGTKCYEIHVTQVEGRIDKHTALENSTIRLTRKTFDKGLTSQIKFHYAEGLESSDIQKVHFASSKKRVAVVNQNGTISPKQKGTAMIYARVYLYDGYSKQFKVKVKVGKRKVTTVPRKS